MELVVCSGLHAAEMLNRLDNLFEVNWTYALKKLKGAETIERKFEERTLAKVERIVQVKQNSKVRMGCVATRKMCRVKT